MRELLLRGKRRYSGNWCYGGYWKIHKTPHNIVYITEENGNLIEIVPETVGLYTGLTDRNGTKIFEGDIVKTKYGRICEVIWFTSPCFQGFDLRPLEDLHLPPDRFDMYAGENLEIIGNIYNNSDIIAERRKDEND